MNPKVYTSARNGREMNTPEMGTLLSDTGGDPVEFRDLTMCLLRF